MLSILIPVYNYDIRPLVAGLRAQCEAAAVAWEILCFDDASGEGFRQSNREMATWPGVTWRELPSNQGRARIRNLLAGAARYEFLLFMDCDSGLVRPDYIRTYLDHLAPGRLLYGGRVYQQEPPRDFDLRLHWTYGRRREQMPAQRRQAQPYHAFMTNNFVVPKAVMTALPFDERLQQYGHEDTIFGLELHRSGIPILHLDNPLRHLGLEQAEVFLEKTAHAIANLHFLYRENPLIDTRLLRLFRQLRQAGLLRASERLLRPGVPFMRRQLCSARPLMRVFDLYKLWLLLREELKTN